MQTGFSRWATVVAFLVSASLQAASFYWVGDDGHWTNPANWSATDGGAGGAGVPDAAANVFLRSSTAYDKTVVFDGGTPPRVNTLEINSISGGHLVITQALGALTATGRVDIGKTAGGYGAFIQSGGTNVLSNGRLCVLGPVAGSTGSYHLVRGCLSPGGQNLIEYVGGAGTGYFVQDGGLHQGSVNFASMTHNSCDLGVGVSAGGRGTYVMNDGRLLFRYVYVGYSGAGYFIQNGGTNGLIAGNTWMTIGNNAGSYGHYTLSNGYLRVNTGITVGNNGTGVLTQAGGMMGPTNVSAGVPIFIGNGAGAGTFFMKGGVHRPYYSVFSVGHNGRGTCNQSGGVIDLRNTRAAGFIYLGNYVHPVVGYHAGGRGVFNLSNGVFSAYSLILGINGTGVVHHTGGRLGLGMDSYWRDVQGGRGDLIVGYTNSGTFYLGNAAESSGLLTNFNATQLGALFVRNSPSAKGLFQGWGTVYLSKVLVNNGRVVADGYGTDRDLDLSRFPTVSNTIENAAGETHGWYAQNRGRLVLPPFTVTTGTKAWNWGESSGDTDIDLVNSARFDFTNVTSGGAVKASLLAADRSTLPGAVVFDPAKMLGIWRVEAAALAFESLTLTFRYDEAARVAAGIGLSQLNMYQLRGDRWAPLSGVVNDAKKQIIATLTELPTDTYFAVGFVPPRGTTICVN